jgi:hypothetical protein
MQEQDRKLVGIVIERDLVINVMAEARHPNRPWFKSYDPRTFACQADDDIEKAFDSMSLFQISGTSE